MRSALRTTFRRMKAAGLGQGRYWTVMQKQERPPSDLLGISAIGWPFRIVLPCGKGFYITAN